MLANSPHEAQRPAWIHKSRLRLLVLALGGPGAGLRKSLSLAKTIGAYLYFPVVRQRLRRLQAAGAIEETPGFCQLMVAGQHMMLGAASDETRLFYEAQGINFTFHNFRRLLDYPSTMLDPIGLFGDRNTIIHHILSTTHRHPLGVR